MIAPEKKAPGRVITFYSYKGGTGRTMLLANVAWILASNGKRVLVVDWDLEAPGLHRYFRPFLADPDLASSPGVIDLVTDHAVACMSGAEGVEEGPIEASVLPFASSLRWPFDKPGTIDFVSAGKQGPSYAARVNSFNWQSFYDRHGGGEFLDALRDSMREEYDYALIDSRTGVSDTAGICTVQLPDELVVCFTLNNQSIEGASAVARSVLDQRGAGFRVFPVPTRVEDGEKRKLERARDHARAAFRDLVAAHVDPAKIDQYWGRVEVPYKIFYAYEEILATFGDRPEQLASLLAAAERLTGYLTGGAVTKLRPPGDEERRRVIVEFERQKQAETKVEAEVERKERREAERREAERREAERRDSAPEADEAPVTKAAGALPASAQPASGEPTSSARQASSTKPSDPGAVPSSPVSSWRRWALGVLVTLAAASIVVALTHPHGLGGEDATPTTPHPPVSATVPSLATVDAEAPQPPAPPSAIAAALEDPRDLDPVDKVALVLALPESSAGPPKRVVEVAADLSRGPLPIAVLRGHTRDITAARFSADGKRVVTGGADGLVRVAASDGRGDARVLAWESSAADRRVFSLDVAPGLVAATTDDGEARIWLLAGESDNFFFPFQHVVGRRSIAALSRDGSMFVRAFEYGEAHAWRITRGDKSFTPEKLGTITNTGPVQSIAFADDGAMLLRSPDAISIWKDPKGRVRASGGVDPDKEFGPKVDVTVSLSARGDGVVAAGSNGAMLWWKQKGGAFEQPASKQKVTAPISTLALDGDRCALATGDGAVLLWKRGEPEMQKLGTHAGRVNALAFGKGGKLLASAGADGLAVVRDLEAPSAAPITVGRAGGAAITAVALSDDGELLVTVSGKTAAVWRLRAPSPAPASWPDTIGYLRRTSNVRLPGDRMQQLLTPAGSAAKGPVAPVY